MSKIVGIDLALSNIGICIFDGKDYKTFLITTSSKDSWFNRISIILNELDRLITHEDKVYIEGYSHGSKFNRELLGEVGGVVKKFIIEKTGKEPVYVSPTQVKKFATGKGKAPPCPKGETKSRWPKKWIKDQVKLLFGREFKTEHETDAFMIALLGATLETVGNQKDILDDLPKHQKEVIQKLLKEED